MQESSDAQARGGSYCGAFASAIFFFNNTPTRIPDNAAARAACSMAFMSGACALPPALAASWGRLCA
jgi:hypothetical protein